MKKLILSVTLISIISFANEVYYDTKNKLMWQDNNEVMNIQKPYVTRDNFSSGKYTKLNGDTAYSYCNNLVLNNFEDWRLPTIKELKELNKIQDNLSFNKRGTYYWSSTYNPKESIKNRSIMVGHDMSLKSPLWERSLIVGNYTNIRCVRNIK